MPPIGKEVAAPQMGHIGFLVLATRMEDRGFEALVVTEEKDFCEVRLETLARRWGGGGSEGNSPDWEEMVPEVEDFSVTGK